MTRLLEHFGLSSGAAIERQNRRTWMSVAKVEEISATSPTSFEDAIQQGLSRAGSTLRHIKGAWIKEQLVKCDEGKIKEYQVNMMVTFVLE
jgi:flavin-binding protein dodecin